MANGSEPITLIISANASLRAALAAALARRALAAHIVDDALGAMTALGRAPFAVMIVDGAARGGALPLLSLCRLAERRHPGIAVVVIEAAADAAEEEWSEARRLVRFAPDADADAVAEAVDDLAHPERQRQRQQQRLQQLQQDQPQDTHEDPWSADATEVEARVAPRLPPSSRPLLVGALNERGGGVVLASLFAQELTGRLTIDRGRAAGALYFANGEPVALDVPAAVAIASALPSSPVAPGAAGGGGVRGSLVLADYQRAVRERVLALVEQTDGAWLFHEDRAFLDVLLLAAVSPFGLMIEARRRQLPPASLYGELAAIEKKRVVARPGLERAAPRLKQFTQGKDVAGALDGGKTVARALAEVGLEPLVGALVILTLRDAGLVSLVDELPASTLPPLLTPLRPAAAPALPPEEPQTAPARAGPSLVSTTGPDATAPAAVQLGPLQEPPAPISLPDDDSAIIEVNEDADLRERWEDLSTRYVTTKGLTDPNAILGVAPGASIEEIEEAYARQLSELSLDDPSDSTAMQARLDELRSKADGAREALVAALQGPTVNLSAPPQEQGALAQQELGAAATTKVTTAAAPAAVKLGKYELLQRLGSGGMAEVFLGRQGGIAGFEKNVVIKRILPAFARNRQFVRQFLEEARLAAPLNHPNIVQLFDLGESKGEYYLVMEHVKGPSLAALIGAAKERAVRTPLEICARIVADALYGLHAAHTFVDADGRRVPIIHRDVTPHNVLVSFDGHVKIADFGVAKRGTERGPTQPGVLKGTLAYASPEYVRGKPADARSDVFAAGATLYFALSGVQPFERASSAATMNAILAGADAVESVRNDVPASLAALVARALAVEPTQRFASARAFALALESFIAAHGVPVSARQVSTWARALLGNASEETRREVERAHGIVLDGAGAAAPPATSVKLEISDPERKETRDMRPSPIGGLRRGNETLDDATVELRWPYDDT